MPIDLFLVDTSAWIMALRQDFLPVVKDRIAYLLKEDAIMTTGMVKLELLGGIKQKKEFRRLKARLDALEMIETNAALWERAYDLAYNLRRKGLTIPYTDILIATSALMAAATIVHADSHFDLMAQHFDVKVESFVEVVKKHKTS